MVRQKRDSLLEGRTNRLNGCKPRKEPYWCRIQRGEHLGYFRPKDSAAGSWVLKYRDADTGTRFKETLPGRADDYLNADGTNVLSWKQATAKAREWFEKKAKDLQNRANGEELPDGPYTVAACLAEYIAEQKRLGKRGIAQAESSVHAHIIPKLGEIEVSKLTRSRLEKWLQDLAEAPRRVRTKAPGSHIPKPRNFKVPRPKKTQHSPPEPPTTEEEKRRRRDSANRVWTTLRAALNFALLRGRVSDGSPWRKGLDFKGTTSTRVRHLSIPEQVKLVRACPDELRRIVTGALHTGARFGELTQLQIQDFDAACGSIHVPANIAKTGKPRNIILTGEGREFFEHLAVGRGPTERIFQRNKARRTKHKNRGFDWGKSEQNSPMKRACIAAGIEPCTFHELRHTAASIWLNAGMSLGDVAEQLGDSEATTKKYYAHLCPDALAARVRRIAPFLGINVLNNVSALDIKPA